MRLLLLSLACIFLLGITSCCDCEEVVEEEAVVRDSSLYGTWRFDSIMLVGGEIAIRKDTIFWGQSEQKRLINTFHKDHSISFDYVTMNVEGEGNFALTKPGYFEKVKVYRTSIEADGYRFVTAYLKAMNEADAYGIEDTTLTVFYEDKLAKFTIEE